MRRVGGDFGGACLIGECDVAPTLLGPHASVLGLPRTGSHIMGTWRDGSGTIHRFLRSVYAYSSPVDRRFYFSNRGGSQLRRQSEGEAMYGGAVATVEDGGSVAYRPAAGSDEMLFSWAPSGVRWRESDLLDVAGPPLGPANHWYNPWPDGGGAAVVSARFRADGTVLGEPMEGFCGLEVHYFPPGRNFLDSPYGWGGREVVWGHMVTEWTDGSLVEASLAVGREGWGFALLRDERGILHRSVEVGLAARLRASGYPDELTFDFDEQSWTWRADPRGEREGTAGARMVGAEGVLQRTGEDRPVRRAMGTIDWWLDGRGDPHVIEDRT